MSEILVVGSLAYDSIASPEGKVAKSLGGAANFFSVAAHHFSPVRVVGVVGDDYSQGDLDVLQKRKGIDTTGIQKIPNGKTFHWEGKYEGDLSEAITLNTELNVFANFNPTLPENYKNSSHVFLANIDPTLQLKVLEQVKAPKLIGADTMNFWITSKLDVLQQMIQKIDVIFINEAEAKVLTKTANAIAASEVLLQQGLKAVVIKRGEYGVVLRMAEGIAILPAYPIAKVFDPTGAGDSFAGACFGYLARAEKFDFATLKQAAVYGTCMASFTVEKFGLGRLLEVRPEDLEERRKQLLAISSFN